MKAYVGVTDNNWFRFLKSQPGIDEVNFWQPGGKTNFRVLDRGEPFLFKLHYPEHYIVGGGFFAHFSKYPATLAWDVFGEKNGAATFTEMRARIEKYRRVSDDLKREYTIGCIILADPFFFDESDWIEPPSDFARSIVQGKSYDLRVSPGKELWKEVELRLHGDAGGRVSERETPMYGDLTLVRPRLGQGCF